MTNLRSKLLNVFVHRNAEPVSKTALTIAPVVVSRRQFLWLSATTSLAWFANASVSINTANAASLPSSLPSSQETYHIFIGANLAKQGGAYKFTSMLGDDYQLKIPRNCEEGHPITLAKRGIHQENIVIVTHTLFDDTTDIDGQIYKTISDSGVQSNSQERCRSVYDLVRSARYAEDLSALDLLDFMVASSKLPEEIKKRYELASRNSRILGIETSVEEALTRSKLNSQQKKLIRATGQCVRNAAPISDFGVLSDLDSIVQHSEIPTSLKQQYSLASSVSRAVTTDIIILDLLQRTYSDPNDRNRYLDTYKKIRDGQQVEDKAVLQALDQTVQNAAIAPEAKLIYLIATNRGLGQTASNTGTDVDAVRNQVEKIAKDLLPTAKDALGSLGFKAGTGISLSTLSGAAATNATLAALGGSMGMLGGVAIVTGGAALIGAAGLVSVAMVSDMDGADRINLGIAALAGISSSAAAMGTAWAMMGTFGVASTGTAISSLSGAAAYSAIMSALGGTSVITGGTALIAFGVGYAVWQYLQANKSVDPRPIIKKLETLLYTVQENLDHPLVYKSYAIAPTIGQRLKDKENLNIFIAPHIPVDKLSTVLSLYGVNTSTPLGESVLALIDTTALGLGAARDGIAFTNQRIIWKGPWAVPETVEYADPDYMVKIQKLLQIGIARDDEQLYRLIIELHTV